MVMLMSVAVGPVLIHILLFFSCRESVCSGYLGPEKQFVPL